MQKIELNRKEEAKKPNTRQQSELQKDPWYNRNMLGHVECRLCSTTHQTDSNYMAHAQGKRHQTNLLRREENKKGPVMPALTTKKVAVAKTVKIGRPGYQVQRKRNPTNNQRILNFQVHYPEIQEGVKPRHRFMSCYEQKKEVPNPSYQYILFAAEPYETVGFKIPSDDIDTDADTFFTTWDKEKQIFTLELAFSLKKGPPRA